MADHLPDIFSTCARCGGAIEVDSQMIGRSVDCPHCGNPTAPSTSLGSPPKRTILSVRTPVGPVLAINATAKNTPNPSTARAPGIRQQVRLGRFIPYVLISATALSVLVFLASTYEKWNVVLDGAGNTAAQPFEIPIATRQKALDAVANENRRIKNFDQELNRAVEGSARSRTNQTDGTSRKAAGL